MRKVTNKNKLFTVIINIEEYSIWFDHYIFVSFQSEPDLAILGAVAFWYSVVFISFFDLVPDLCGQVLGDPVAGDSHSFRVKAEFEMFFQCTSWKSF